MFLNTARIPWVSLRGAVTTDDTPITDFSYSTSWPTSNTIKLNDPPFQDANGVLIAFHGTDAADETVNYLLYGRTRQNGPIQLLLGGVVTLGTQNCTTNPITGATIANGEWADTITVTDGIFAGIVEILDSADNRICMLKFDTMHIEDLYLEIDIPASGQVASIYAILTGY